MEQKQESLRKLLNKIAKEHKYENHEIIINEITSGGANYTSTLFTVIIREENKEDLHLFAKISAFGEELRKEMPVDFYDTERFAYKKLVKMYASLEEENGVPEEHRLFFTKCYGFDVSKNQDILVLENLLALGYGTHDRFASFDWKYASTAVTDLAKMHALSFAFSKSNPDEFEKDSAALKYIWKESENMDNVVKNMVNLALENVNPENKDALEKFVENKPHAFQMTDRE